MKDKSSLKSSEKSSGKLRRGFNFIDFLLIVFALVIILTAINVVSPMSFIDKLRADTSYTVHYTVEITGVDDEYLDKIKENDAVVDAVSKYSLGTVETVDYTSQYSTLEYNESLQEGALAVHKDKYNVLITIKAEGSYIEEKGYSVNDKRIAVGEKLSLRFPDYVGEGYCIALSTES